MYFEIKQKWLFAFSYFEVNATSSTMPSSFLVRLVRSISYLVDTHEELLQDIKFFLFELLKNSSILSKHAKLSTNQ